MPPLCSTITTYALSADSSGGYWNGPGVTNNTAGIFNPSSVGAGNYVISYTISNEVGCSVTANQTISVINCVGIQEYENESPIQIYPNPFNNLFTLIFSEKMKNASIFIYDFTGKKVYYLENFSGNKLETDLGFLASGVYVINVKNGTESYTKRILKQ